MKKKAVKKVDSPKNLRNTYLQNRSNMLEDFKAALVEVQRPEPSVGGLIAGMNFQQMSAKQVFFLIVEQEEYIEYTKEHKPSYVLIKEEKDILKNMIKEAKAVFKKDYAAWYKDAK